MTITADQERRQERIVADAEKRAAKPYVLVINEQVQGLGDKYRTLNRTEQRYTSEGHLIAGLKRRFPGHAWKKAANNVSFIFSETSDNGRKRIQVLAYREQATGYSVQINLNGMCDGTTKR